MCTYSANNKSGGLWYSVMMMARLVAEQQRPSRVPWRITCPRVRRFLSTFVRRAVARATSILASSATSQSVAFR